MNTNPHKDITNPIGLLAGCVLVIAGIPGLLTEYRVIAAIMLICGLAISFTSIRR